MTFALPCAIASSLHSEPRATDATDTGIESNSGLLPRRTRLRVKRCAHRVAIFVGRRMQTGVPSVRSFMAAVQRS
jgi:hypothetical protein